MDRIVFNVDEIPLMIPYCCHIRKPGSYRVDKVKEEIPFC